MLQGENLIGTVWSYPAFAGFRDRFDIALESLDCGMSYGITDKYLMDGIAVDGAGRGIYERLGDAPAQLWKLQVAGKAPSKRLAPILLAKQRKRRGAARRKPHTRRTRRNLPRFRRRRRTF